MRRTKRPSAELTLYSERNHPMTIRPKQVKKYDQRVENHTLTQSEDAITLVWPAKEDRIYRVQHSINLQPDSWFDTSEDLEVGSATLDTPSVSSPDTMFYRVLVIRK